MQLMLRATVCVCPAFDPFSFEEDGLSPPEVDVGRSEIGQVFVVSHMVEVRYEGRDLGRSRSPGR
jgi:hypothetical protein